MTTSVPKVDKTVALVVGNNLVDLDNPLIVGSSDRSRRGKVAVTITNLATEQPLIIADAAFKNDIFALTMCNCGAAAVDTIVEVRDTTGGAVVYKWLVKAGQPPVGFRGNTDAACPQAAVNSQWTVKCLTATTSLEVTAEFVKRI